MNMPELKILTALRSKSIIPEIRVAKVIEKMHEFHAARPAEFLKLIGEKTRD